MYGYIYKTTDLKHDKIYIGQHKSSQFDTKYYGSGRIITDLLKNYPRDNFTCQILCECQSQDELNEKEIYWINELDSRNPDVGYNLSSGGGYFGDSGYHLGMLGKSQSDLQRQKASENGKYVRTEEWKKHKSEQMTGNTNAHGNAGGPGKFTGKHHTQQTKDILSDKLSPIVTEWHKNLSEEDKVKRANNISNSKKGAICITDGVKNYYIQPNLLPEYLSKGFYKMSVQAYRKINNV